MGELAASIAHEVSQPLTAVVTNGSACLRWLGGATPNLDEARDAVARIIVEGNRAGEVIGKIRGLLKKSPAQPTAVEVNEVIREVLALTRHEIVRSEVALKTELGTGIPAVTCDRVELQQVMMNLIVNAVEAMGSMLGGARELVVASRHETSGPVVVTVRDSGVGLDDGSLAQIFNPFFTTKASGMGMGLSISRSLLEAHGGRLWATPNEGRGASFHFSLPVPAPA
jgi:signal transduction histidine kinase